MACLSGCSGPDESGQGDGETITPTDTKTPTAALSPASPTPTPESPFSPPDSEGTEGTPSTATPTDSEQPLLRAETAESEAFFGQTVAVSADGTTAFVGAHRADTSSGEDSGAVYIFKQQDGAWALETILQPENGTETLFGSSIAVTGDGNTVLIGADGDDTIDRFAGAAYLYTRSNGSWAEQTQLLPNNGSVGDRFGSAVAIDSDGTTAAIAAEDKDIADNTSFGAVYVFEITGEQATQQKKLTGKEGAGREFGADIALSADGTTLLVGDENEEGQQGESIGAAYVFTQVDGQWQRTRLPHDGAEFDRFGNAVALSNDGTTAVVTAWNEADFAGGAYVFERDHDKWRQKAELLPDGLEQQDWFGTSVALTATGETALIGSYRDTTPTGETGSGYVFTQSDGEWSENNKFVPDQIEADDEFGTAVAISAEGHMSVVGAPQDDVENTSDSGTAYVFSLTS